MSTRVLLIDDDPKLHALLQTYLAPHEVILAHAADGRRGLAAVAEGGVDLIVLDVMMPGMDGLDVLRVLRKTSALPVIMLTGRGDEADRVVGLELGADDYLSKPVYPRELLARIRAVLRRVAPRLAAERIVLGDLEINVNRRSASIGAQDIVLTALEFDLLLALASRAGRVISRDALWEAAGRGEVRVGDRTIDVHVSRLRAKLGDDARSPSRLKTVRGMGYMLAKGSG
jgi:DNA-binding response OmpR family regulator